MTHQPLKVRTHYPLIEDLDLSVLMPAKLAPHFENPSSFLSNVLKEAPRNSGAATIPFSQARYDFWSARLMPLAFVDQSSEQKRILWMFSDLTCVLLVATSDRSYGIIPWPFKLVRFLRVAGKHYSIENSDGYPGFHYDYKSGSLTLTSHTQLLPQDGCKHDKEVVETVRDEFRTGLIADLDKLVRAFDGACPLGADAQSIDEARNGTVAFPWFLLIDPNEEPQNYQDFVTDITLASDDLGIEEDVMVDIDARCVRPDGMVEPANIHLTRFSDDDYMTPPQPFADLMTKLFDAAACPVKLADQLGQRRGYSNGQFNTVEVTVSTASAHARIKAKGRIQAVLEQTQD